VIGFVYIRSPVLPLPSTSSFPPTHFFLPALHHLVSSQQQFFTSTSTQVHLGLHQHDEHQSIKVSITQLSFEFCIPSFYSPQRDAKVIATRFLFHHSITTPITVFCHYILYLPIQVPNYCISRVFKGSSEQALHFVISPPVREIPRVSLDFEVFAFQYVIFRGQLSFTFGKSQK